MGFFSLSTYVTFSQRVFILIPHLNTLFKSSTSLSRPNTVISPVTNILRTCVVRQMYLFLFFTDSTHLVYVFEYNFCLFRYSITFFMPAQLCDILLCLVPPQQYNQLSHILNICRWLFPPMFSGCSLKMSAFGLLLCFYPCPRVSPLSVLPLIFTFLSSSLQLIADSHT